ncbi:hypothetical protein I2494_02500 [Budviciaceae bacterium BWR-B9]|uniref:DUF3592 domain-containing protein n=1 Tax=Limnobaculum allomyrinae TaxID=2791986 RepID=A0ABS1ILI1_9GAMM|nr:MULTISPECIES: hypothetical protein [Limnobaculum]MBK5142604.1 hypothetical protein [Limnobaculum allomyrinae]MBV7690510.1 hypothetical protein [Limnobaculum sp. M2-1]
MKKRTYNGFIVLGVVIFVAGLVFSATSGYAVWRSYESIGIYTFTSTGEIMVKEERERTGRRTSKVVNRHYAVFASADGKYRSEEKISPSLKTGISRGGKYNLEREVFIDRTGDYKVTAPQSKDIHDNRVRTNFMVAGLISLFDGVMIFITWRMRRRYILNSM